MISFGKMSKFVHLMKQEKSDLEKTIKKIQSCLAIESCVGRRDFWKLEIKGGVKVLKFHSVESLHGS